MSDRFTQAQVDFLHGLKNNVVYSCKECNGTGWLKDNPCRCRKIFVYLKELVYARIPQEYWDWEWDDLEIQPKTMKILLKKYIDNFDNAKELGKGVCFLGTNGIGKTTLMCEIGKISVSKNYSTLYITAQEYINYKMQNDEEMINRIENETQVLLLDELDKPYMKKGSDYVPAQIESLLRNLLPKNTIICITTNWHEEEIKEYFGDSIYSIIKRKIKFVTLKGKDFSTELQDDWEDGLTTGKINYTNSYMEKLSKTVERK